LYLFFSNALINLTDCGDPSSQESSYEISLAPTPQTAVTVIEMDAVVKQRIAENVVNSIATLKSLKKLVMGIPNMVVLDHIRTEVSGSEITRVSRLSI
jgi:hypothetical protein